VEEETGWPEESPALPGAVDDWVLVVQPARRNMALNVRKNLLLFMVFSPLDACVIDD
jgi:hypothetical protein